MFRLIATGLVGGAMYHDWRKRMALEEARSLAGEKGIINLGADGHTQFSREVANLSKVKVNVDIRPDGAKSLQANLEEAHLPFYDREFGVAFASHVLEHLENWELALTEWNRVADWVIVVVPHPLSLTGRIHLDHKQFFGFEDKAEIETRWPRTKVFM